ncbi:MAG: TIGR03016 family PEP-CTERM system-associated outer membrane protein [Propionivibrio sp.]
MATSKGGGRFFAPVVTIGLILGGCSFPAVAATWKITPMITVIETATDNVALSQTNKQSDLVSDISPGIHIEALGGRSKLNFDYQMHNLIYAQSSSRNRTQHSLNAQGTLEAVDNWLFVDASGMISQQSISAFGGAVPTNVNVNDSGNTTETSTYRISPYIQGSFGSFADYQLRYALSTTNNRSTNAFDSNTRELSGMLNGETALASLGWSVNGSMLTANYSDRPGNEADRLQGVLTYNFSPQFRVSVFGGREANDYLTPEKKSYTTKGAGLEWAPTERTSIAASRERRFFGDSNTFTVSHRTAQTSWRYLESKDATVQSGQQSSLGLTVYDLAYSLCSGVGTGTPQEQAACASSLLGTTPAATPVPGGFLTSGVTLQQRRELSFALLGSRNSVTFTASQSESERLSQSLGTGFLVGENTFVDNIRQRIASVSWTHQLSPLSALTGSLFVARSTGTSTQNAPLETTQKTVNLNFTTRLGPFTNAGVGIRRVVVDGTTNYTENALTGVLSHQF